MGISVTKLLIILAITIIVFGTKRLKNIGADLGGAIKTFRKAIKDGEEVSANASEDVIDGEVAAKDKDKV
ncbi:twin-arginine translocase TatA/TatE family subunit [Crenothrix polyspora]|uniref:Sec-independent protein translocase protein TatA n=1 Tax=Crenothrix polyspora TaxID=360316 RepID=A0A1R4HEV5_9GAMM|nr:twin-arginine translocase TatA/TatE family subunit [Crenothrix polyspora]SJM94754.1 Sec-independent protein translocase protein TatA [Crenothrix polyspora]